MNFTRTRQCVAHTLLASLLVIALFPTHLAASSLTLAWSPNTERDLAGYTVYCGTKSRDYERAIDVGDVTEYTVRGLKPETRYYFALTAYDNSGYESYFSAEVSGVTTDGQTSFSASILENEADEGGCFIATAVYGSYQDPHVVMLRDFRDRFLRTNSLGRACVNLYFRYGPRVAPWVRECGVLRVFTRQALVPLIGVSSLSVTATTPHLFILLLLCFLSISFILLHPYFRRTR